MINPNDSIRFTNVVSKRYRFNYRDMDKAMVEFRNEIDKRGVSAKGPLFYSLNNVPTDKMMNVEFFMPIEQHRFETDEDIYFHSYFGVDNMISISVYANFEKNTQIAYAALLNFINENKLKQVTPIFHVILGNETMEYVVIKVGVISIEENENSESQLKSDANGNEQH